MRLKKAVDDNHAEGVTLNMTEMARDEPRQWLKWSVIELLRI